MKNQKYINHTISFTNSKIHKYTSIWRKTQITFLIVEVEERLQPSYLIQHHPPSMKALFTSWKARSANNAMSQRETNSTSLQITKFEPPDLCDEGSIYKYLQRGESAYGFLISVISLIVLGSNWIFHDLLLILGWIQQGKCYRGSF